MASGLALLYYAERLKTKRQDMSRKPLKSLPDERPVIRMKTKEKEGRDDVSFDLDDEEEDREDEEMKKESAEEEREVYRKREKDEIYERERRSSTKHEECK